MKLEYDPLSERFLLRGAAFFYAMGTEDLDEQTALKLLQKLKEQTPKPKASASRPEPLGILADPEVEAYLRAGGQVQKVGVTPKRVISALSLEDLDLDHL